MPPTKEKSLRGHIALGAQGTFVAQEAPDALDPNPPWVWQRGHPSCGHPCVPMLCDKGWHCLPGSERALLSQHCDMNAGNFTTIQKQLIFSKNLRHASLKELHSIPPTMAVATCGSLGCKPEESPPEGEAAARGL